MQGVTTWYNAYAKPDSYDGSDFVAGLGGAWNDMDDATMSIRVTNNHWDFRGLFENSGAADYFKNNVKNGCGCQ